MDVLEAACAAVDRDPATVHRSRMSMAFVAGDQLSLDRMTRWHMSLSGATGSPAEYRKDKAKNNNFLGGLTSELVDTLGKFADMGVEEVQFEHFNFGSDEWPEYLAREIAPAAAAF